MNILKIKSESQVERKIKNLEHNLEYTKKVYPGYTKKINRLRSQIYYYRKKLST